MYIFNAQMEMLKILSVLSLSVLGGIFAPNWLFLGLEKMKELVPLVITGRILTVPLFLIFVKNSDDIVIAAFIQSSAFLVSALLCIMFIINKKLLGKPVFEIRMMIESVKDSFFMFITNFASNMYMAAVPIILGMLLGPIYVGYYKVADNIKAIALNLMSPVFNVVYSRFSSLLKEDISSAWLIMRKYFLFSFLLALTGSGIAFMFSDVIIKIIAGSEYSNSVIILKVMAFVIIVSVFNQFLGVQTLVPLGYSKYFSLIVCIGGGVCLSSIFPLIKFYGVLGAAISVLFAEMSIGILLIGFHKVKKIPLLVGKNE